MTVSLADRETEELHTHNIKAKAKLAMIAQTNVVQKSDSIARARCFKQNIQNL